MPSITSNGTVIVRVSAGLYGLAPGNAIYSELVNASYSGGVNALVNNLYSSDFGSSTTTKLLLHQLLLILALLVMQLPALLTLLKAN
jgi:hypothetical protein